MRYVMSMLGYVEVEVSMSGQRGCLVGCLYKNLYPRREFRAGNKCCTLVFHSSPMGVDVVTEGGVREAEDDAST